MSDEKGQDKIEVLERQIANLREQNRELNGILEVIGSQLQLCVQMALRHDWTLDKMTGGQLLDRDAAASEDGKGLVQVKIPVPHKDWIAVLMPVKQSKILTAGGGRALMPPSAPPNGKPKLVTKE